MMKAPKPSLLLTHFEKSYEPKSFESERYQYWLEENCFASSDQNLPNQKSFAIMIPPPNVTGVLHVGHALTCTIQDILIRWKRMKGFNALWLPGTDHAGIATQTQVEKAIAKEGKNDQGKPLSRHDLGREKFLERTWKWKEDHQSGITNQLKKLGSSLDWKRERFTMDEGFSKAVREVFVSLYEKGLIYRGERLINWCTRCQTALSDLEVIPTDRKGKFYHLKYPIVEASGEAVKDSNGNPVYLVIATTRPETLLGDSAVAVHPEDERFQTLKGKFAILPLTGRKIPVIQDEYVDREFGSGALKITPAHDFNDYELGKKHQLEFITVISKDGRMLENAGEYQGLKLSEAREKIILDLEAQGYLLKLEDHANKVGLCQRCDQVAEPLISKQWFVKIAPLAKPAIEAVQSGKIEFRPKSFERVYFEWMNNIQDWCISRQLWWGHQIPAWYCDSCQEISVSREDLKNCIHCQSSSVTRDEDVLDTWFSSGLWPFGTLGWPEKTNALKTFYPGAILETGSDIIFFWVARMIMMGIHFMGEVPFERVYLHGLIRDEKGQKMSKSKGNVIDPLVLIDQYGADPLRFCLTALSIQGRDLKLSSDRVEGYKAFANKLWNAVKFFHLQLTPDNGGPISEPSQGLKQYVLSRRNEMSFTNQWILSRLQKMISKVENGFEGFELNESAQALYDFIWLELCDWYIELSKKPLKEQGSSRLETLYTLRYVLEETLKTLHPIMPMLTEELWLSLPFIKGQTIMLEKFPVSQPELLQENAETIIEKQKSFIQAIRNFRGENNLSPKVEFDVFVVAREEESLKFINSYESELKTLSKLKSIQWIQPEYKVGKYVAIIPLLQPSVELRINLEGLVDLEAERQRILKEIAKTDADIAHVESKLSKESFILKAPKELIEEEKSKLALLHSKRNELKVGFERLNLS